MRQAIRGYSVVALVVLSALFFVLVTNWDNVVGTALSPSHWLVSALLAALGFQIWALLVVPLGVLAAYNAAQASLRGWRAFFIALLVLAPLFAAAQSLVGTFAQTLTPVCIPPCSPGPFGPGPWNLSDFALYVSYALAFFPIPLAALAYTFVAPQARLDAVGTVSLSVRRWLITGAMIALVIMPGLDYLGNSNLIFGFVAAHASPGPGAFTAVSYAFNLQHLLSALWVALAALPTAVASLALVSAVQTGRRLWTIGWAALAVLALLATSSNSFFSTFIIFDAARLAIPSLATPSVQAFLTLGGVIPALIMLLAIVYALMVMRPPQQRATATAPAIA
jgi:hypothetical protein